MTSVKKRPDFFTSEEGVEVAQLLKSMVLDKAFFTEPSFSANTDQYPNNQIPFIDKHMSYLRDHPSLDPHQYLANLRLMTKIKH